jgi:hypothetical protein
VVPDVSVPLVPVPEVPVPPVALGPVAPVVLPGVPEVPVAPVPVPGLPPVVLPPVPAPVLPLVPMSVLPLVPVPVLPLGVPELYESDEPAAVPEAPVPSTGRALGEPAPELRSRWQPTAPAAMTSENNNERLNDMSFPPDSVKLPTVA